MKSLKDNNNEFERELGDDPYDSKGFNEQLKRRIEQRINQENRWSFRWVYGIGRLAVVGAVLVFALQADWSPGPAKTAQPLTPPDPAGVSQSVGILSSPAAAETSAPFYHSALLIGFREDGSDSAADSRYRTLLIAPVHDKLKVTAEGEGILVPYGMEFWKIDPTVIRRNTESYEYLSAKPAIDVSGNEPGDDAKNGATEAAVPADTLVHTEKLLFAGNKYVSILSKNPLDGTTETWVKTLPQLDDTGPSPASPEAGDPPHVSYRAAMYGELSATPNATDPSSPATLIGDVERWAIVRSHGAWTVAGLGLDNGSEATSSGPQKDETLPERIVSHDTLVRPWQDIASLRPDARDAVSAPTGEWIAVLTDRAVYVYAVVGTIRPEPLLTVPLKGGETMVMAQWATDRYIAKWIQKANMYLKS